MEKGLSFEKSMERLEEIIVLLEGGGLDLDKSLEVFEEGVTLYRYLTEQLERAEGKIKLIMADKDGDRAETDFESKGDQEFEF